MSTNPVGWFEIYVDDMARARRFYETVFGFTLQRMNVESPELWGFPSDRNVAGGIGGALVHMPGFAAGGNSTLVYFRCAECAVEAARVAQAGGSIQKPKTSIGEYGHIVLAIDTEGNMFGLHSPT